MEARCAAGSGARCPGGASAAGNADPTLCDGAPVYIAGWTVLLRVSEGGGTRWYLSDATALQDCAPADIDTGYHRSDLNLGGPEVPTAPAYGQWSTPEYYESISVVAGGGR